MKRLGTIIFVLFAGSFASAQVQSTDSISNEPMNTAQNIIAGNGGKSITVSGYGEVHFNQQFGDSVKHNGNMDVHRVIMFLGYKFSDKTFFVSEFEFEHVKELFVEQAFLQHNINPYVNVKAGLLLVPMGIVNEYHESPTFNGVERPNVDGKLIPTTWREVGAGFSGKFSSASLRYQLYCMNGFLSYNGTGKIGGSSGYRGGRQKGAESVFTSPNFAGKIDYYGIKGLKLGLSGYFGNTQSTAYEGAGKEQISSADSTVIGISMVGVDARYQNKGFEARGQFFYSSNSNVEAYNTYTGKDLGATFMGYYVEAGYNVLRLFNKNTSMGTTLFARYETYDTHNSVVGEMTRNLSYYRTDVTVGATIKLANGAVFKADYQNFINADPSTDAKHQYNLGIGVWF